MRGVLNRVVEDALITYKRRWGVIISYLKNVAYHLLVMVNIDCPCSSSLMNYGFIPYDPSVKFV